MPIDPCELCNNSSTTFDTATGDTLHQKCDSCGDFIFSGTALAIVKLRKGAENKRRIKGWVLDQNRSGVVPAYIDSYVLKSITDRPLPSVIERADRILQEAVSRIDGIIVNFNVNDERFIGASYSLDREELVFLTELLIDKGLVVRQGERGGNYRVTHAGFAYHAENFMVKQNSSMMGFVAMSFAPEMEGVFSEGIRVGIMNAGYEAMRVDRHEHINKIDDEIISQINASKFVVADFTGHRGGVYFEAGYALGNDIPVFWTCCNTEMSDLHFDIRQYNCINWQTPKELSERLASRIEAVMGRGPNFNE